MAWFLLRVVISLRLLERAAAWKSALFGVGGIALMNWNLKVNSIDLYQLSKPCTIPYMAAALCASLAVLRARLALFTVNDVEVSARAREHRAGADNDCVRPARAAHRRDAAELRNRPWEFLVCLSALLVETSR
jgi:hypothetical protein